MRDVDEQLRQYAVWLAEVADAEAERRSNDQAAVAPDDRGRRTGWLIGAAASVVAVTVGGLVVLSRSASDDIPAPPATEPSTTIVATTPSSTVAPTSSSVVDDVPDVVAEAFAVVVAGRTFVLLPEGPDTAVERPYLSFPDSDDDGVAVVGSGGCTTFVGRGGWADAGGGRVSLDGSLAVGTQGCSPGDDVMPFSATTLLNMSATSADVLDLLDASGSRSLVDVDMLPPATALLISGRWDAGSAGELIIDPDGSSIVLDGCRTSIEIVGSSLNTSGFTGAECRRSNLQRALDTVKEAETSIELRLVDDVLLIVVTASDQPTEVYALPSAGPLIDPVSVSPELGAAFGYRPGDEVTAAEIETHVSSILGPTTHDTRWFVTPTNPAITEEEDCMGGNTTRVLWWNDLSFIVWQLPDGTERMYAWSIGDPRAVRLGDRREPYTPAASDRSGITSDGPLPIGVGTAAADVTEAYPDVMPSTGSLFEDGAETWQLGPTTLVVLNDTVIGLGSEVFFC